MSARNHGVFESEFRLIPYVGCAIFGTMGLIGFGISAGMAQNYWAPIIWFGVLNFVSSRVLNNPVRPSDSESWARALRSVVRRPLLTSSTATGVRVRVLSEL